MGTLNVIKLDELDIICAVLGCSVEELLIPEPDSVAVPTPDAEDTAAVVGEARPVFPRSRDGRSMPPR
ncbi:helix-turn-helix domain-containing protein [Nocardia sp. CA-107356]|uniref:helix-turn-helix domain-containing protein n=1 Tax=Nocardia sp. CA-107356 TaxID=3239972 RepID=UPI003D94676D